MKLGFSWDDGALEDQRLFKLHEKYEIPGMFFIPTRNKEGRKVLTPEMIRTSESRYISFGGHTENHTYLTRIPIDAVGQEVKENKDYLENILGHEIYNFCLPGGQYNDAILKTVYKHFRTIRTADTMNFTYGSGPLKPAFHFYPRGLKSLIGNAKRHNSFDELLYVATHPWKGYFELINDLIAREINKKDSVIMIWGHSWEIEQYDLWSVLEKLFIYAKENANICQYDDFFIKNVR